MDAITKTCSICKQDKLLEAFHVARKHLAGRFPWCRQCAHERYLKYKDKAASQARKKRYGISEDQYQAMLMEQERRCRICGEIAPLSVDHDHGTGKARGLLCSECNFGLGKFRDDLNILKAAVFYLERHAT